MDEFFVLKIIFIIRVEDQVRQKERVLRVEVRSPVYNCN